MNVTDLANGFISMPYSAKAYIDILNKCGKNTIAKFVIAVVKHCEKIANLYFAKKYAAIIRECDKFAAKAHEIGNSECTLDMCMFMAQINFKGWRQELDSIRAMFRKSTAESQTRYDARTLIIAAHKIANVIFESIIHILPRDLQNKLHDNLKLGQLARMSYNAYLTKTIPYLLKLPNVNNCTFIHRCQDVRSEIIRTQDDAKFSIDERNAAYESIRTRIQKLVGEKMTQQKKVRF
jgi:hypothetical protein